MQAEGLRQDLRQRDGRVAELEQRLLQTAGACRRCRSMASSREATLTV